jgi:hypothetical protein
MSLVKTARKFANDGERIYFINLIIQTRNNVFFITYYKFCS